jgi:hypothetical protein
MCDPTTTICRLIEVNHRLLFKRAHYDGDMHLMLYKHTYDSAAARFHLAFDIDPTPLAFDTPPMSRGAVLLTCTKRSAGSSMFSNELLRTRDGNCRTFAAETPQQLLVCWELRRDYAACMAF